MKTLDDIHLNERDRQAIKSAASILRQKFPIEQIMLFGAKARGDDDAESDIDLLILTRHRLTWQERDKITSVLFDLQLERKVVISTLVVPKKEWEQGMYQVLPIHDEVQKDGVVA